MNLDDLSTQLLFTTVPVWVERQDGVTASGTAFIYNLSLPEPQDQSIPLLVTNRHTVAGASRALIELIGRDGEQPAPDRRIRVEVDPSRLLKPTGSELDLAALPLGPIINNLEAQDRPLFFRSITPDLVPSEDTLNDLSAMEDVVFIGYPSGLRDEETSLPLIRRGITSTPVWSDFSGESAFLIDAGVFPGSSGSPVFILNRGSYPTRQGISIGSRLLFLGLVTETMVRAEEGGSRAFLGLGKVARSTAINAFLRDEVRQLIASGD